MTLTFTDNAFESEVLRSDTPVLVDVFTEGCGGCRRIAPVIDTLAIEYAGKVKVGKLDALSNSRTAFQYQIRMAPTVVVFKAGQVAATRAGVADAATLRKMLDDCL